MKHILTISTIIFLLSGSMLNAQNKGFVPMGGFGNPYMKIMGQQGTSVAIGGEGAMVFSNNWFIGGFGLGTSSMSSLKSDKTGFEDYHIEFEHGGIWLGYMLRLNKRVYLNFSGKAGAGQVQLNNRKLQTTIYDNSYVLKPQVEAEFKLLAFMSVVGGVGYTQFLDVDLAGYNSNDYSGFEGKFGLRFGWW